MTTKNNVNVIIKNVIVSLTATLLLSSAVKAMHIRMLKENLAKRRQAMGNDKDTAQTAAVDYEASIIALAKQLTGKNIVDAHIASQSGSSLPIDELTVTSSAPSRSGSSDFGSDSDDDEEETDSNPIQFINDNLGKPQKIIEVLKTTNPNELAQIYCVLEFAAQYDNAKKDAIINALDTYAQDKKIFDATKMKVRELKDGYVTATQTELLRRKKSSIIPRARAPLDAVKANMEKILVLRAALYAITNTQLPTDFPEDIQALLSEKNPAEEVINIIQANASNDFVIKRFLEEIKGYRTEWSKPLVLESDRHPQLIILQQLIPVLISNIPAEKEQETIYKILLNKNVLDAIAVHTFFMERMFQATTNPLPLFAQGATKRKPSTIEEQILVHCNTTWNLNAGHAIEIKKAATFDDLLVLVKEAHESPLLQKTLLYRHLAYNGGHLNKDFVTMLANQQKATANFSGTLTSIPKDSLLFFKNKTTKDMLSTDNNKLIFLSNALPISTTFNPSSPHVATSETPPSAPPTTPHHAAALGTHPPQAVPSVPPSQQHLAPHPTEKQIDTEILDLFRQISIESKESSLVKRGPVLENLRGILAKIQKPAVITKFRSAQEQLRQAASIEGHIIQQAKDVLTFYKEQLRTSFNEIYAILDIHD